MALVKDFDRKLHDLWMRRTADVRLLVRKRRGRPKHFSKRIRERGIHELQSLATRILSKTHARAELRDLTRHARQTRLPGRGLENRYQRMVAWARRHLRGPIVYSFWNGRRCLYVGQGKSWRRLKAYRRSVFLQHATTLRVRSVRGKTQLPKAECLSAHLFEPRHNLSKIAGARRARKCPICKAHRQIRDELRAMFRMT